MKYFVNLYLHKFILIVSIFLIFSQVGYAQTVAEFQKKTESEQKKIIETLVRNEISKRSVKNVGGRKKSDEQLKLDRRYTNLMRTFFNVSIEGGQNKVVTRQDNLTVIFFAQLSLKVVLAIVVMNTPEIPIDKIFIDLLNQKYTLYYTKPMETWREGLDAKSDDEQTESFRRIADYLSNSELDELKIGAETLTKAADSMDAKIKKNEQDLKEGKTILHNLTVAAINELDVIFRPLKRNPKTGMLDFKISQKIPIKFDLQCYIKGNKSKDLSISILSTRQ